MGKIEKIPGIEIDVDLTKIKKAFSAERIGIAERVAMKRVLVETMARIRKGFQLGGYNPATGAPGFWPKRVVPKGVTAKNAKKFRAKTKGGVVARIRVGGKVLVNTGRYRDSITASAPTLTSDGVQGFVGTNVEYAKHHEQPGNAAGFIKWKASGAQAAFLRRLGFTVRKGSTITLPQRRVFVMPDPWRVDMADIFGNELNRELQRA